MACLGQNLVPNPSFELYSTCPNSAGQIDYAVPWFQATTGTPDYYNSCVNGDTLWGNSLGVPKNFFGYQPAKTGTAYSGFMIREDVNWPVNFREYIEVQLISPLVAGTKYFVSFYVSLGDSSNYASDDIGVYFSNDSALSDTSYLLYYTPQFINLSNNFITDTTNWTIISGEYIAIGGEQFITIGNFMNDVNTDTLSVAGGGDPFFYNYPYYYVDDICVSTDSATCNFGTNINNENSLPIISVYPNPTKDELFISVNDKKIKSAFIEITDITGKVVYSSEITIDEMVGKLNLNIDNGVYLLKIYDINTKKQTVQKVVINK